MSDGPSLVVDVGAHQRLCTGATWRAVEVRDQEFFHETCECGDRTVGADGRSRARSTPPPAPRPPLAT